MKKENYKNQAIVKRKKEHLQSNSSLLHLIKAYQYMWLNIIQRIFLYKLKKLKIPCTHTEASKISMHFYTGSLVNITNKTKEILKYS